MNSQYDTLASDRQLYIDVTRALEPLLFDILRESKTRPKRAIVRNQSLGADLIASLSSKLLKSIFPFGSQFFRLSVEQETEEDLSPLLIALEEEITKEANKGVIRGFLVQVLEHLLISGNCLIDFNEDTPQLYSLDEYIVQRRENGDWHTIIIKKEIVVLPDDETIYQKYIGDIGAKEYLSSRDYRYDFYLRLDRVDDRVEIKEFINDLEVVENKREVSLKTLKLYPIRLYEENGYNYAFGYAYRYLGDLLKYDTISKAMGESIVAGSKLIHLVNPASVLADNIKELADSMNGDFIVGNDGDIVPYGGADFRNIQYLAQILAEIERRLSMGFLRGTGVVKQGQQTAYEIQTLINEMLEKFGGFFVTLSESLQRPTFEYLLKKLKIDKDLKNVEVEFLNGVSQLRDSEKLQKLQMIAPLEVMYQQGLGEALSSERVLTEYCKALGINKEDILKSEEEVKAEEQVNINRQIIEGQARNMPQIQQGA